MVVYDVNYVAVAIATVASIVIGFLWYSPFVFGKTWMRLVGIDEKKEQEQKKNMPKSMIIEILMTFIGGYVLAVFIVSTASVNAVAGATVGFLAWLGFVATTQLGQTIWEGRPQGLFVLNTGSVLVRFVVMGIIIGVL